MKKAGIVFSLFLFLISCKTKQYVQQIAKVDTSHILLDSTRVADTDIETLIRPYRATLEREMNISLGELAITLKKGKPNSNLGNWFADILEEAGRFIFEGKPIDFALQNYGGLRLNSIEKGTIKVGDIYSLMPFDNTLILMTIDSSTFRQLMDQMAANGGWPISKSITYTLQNKKATDIYLNKEPLAARDSIHVLLPDYIANGGDDCFFLKSMPRLSSHLYIRDIVIEHLTKLQEQGEMASIDSAKRIK